MEGQELPVGWAVAPLEAVVEILDSIRVPVNTTERDRRIAGKEKQALYPYYGATGQVGWIDDYLFDDELILLGEDGVPFFDPLKKKAYLVEGKFWVNNHAHVIRPIKGACDPAFLQPFLNQFDYTGYVTGSTRLKLTQAAMREIPIVLAPYSEQHRIAAKLDTTLAAVEACRQRLDGVAATLKRFRQAVLAAATSGELTREWREERGMEKDWLGTCLSDIADIQGGLTKDSKKQDLGDPELPYLRVANVQRGYLDLREMAFIRVPRKRLDALLLQDGDILFNEGGDRDKVGRGWIWEAQITECVFQNHVFRARLLNEGNQPKYVSWWANTCGASHFLGQGKQTTNLASISKTTLGLLPIQLPCAAEQEEIVRRVETFFTLADQLEARLTAGRKVVDRLTPALLAKAFRGELVPQDPNDEPASVLLERIRAYRQVDTASGKPTRPRRRNAQTSITKPTALTYMLTRNNVQANHLSAILKECGPLSAEALWSASQLEIDDFYAQLRDEEDHGFLRENCGDSPNSPRLLEPTA
jgi:type I restriction enzyme S subunit